VGTFLSNVYGLQSKEFLEFQGIRFEIDKPLQQAQQAFESALPLALPLQIPQDHYYRERLSDADDFLSSLLVL
jgi:hypothetical protein